MQFLALFNYISSFDSTDGSLIWQRRFDSYGIDTIFIVHNPDDLTCLYTMDINRYKYRPVHIFHIFHIFRYEQ